MFNRFKETPIDVNTIDTYHIKGNIAFYRPNSIAGKAILLFAKKYSHTSLILDKDHELDAEWKRGVTINKPDWDRDIDMIILPFDKRAYDLAWRKYAGKGYGKRQLFGMTLRKWRIVNTKGAVCSELMAYYLMNHRFIDEKNIQLDEKDPNYYTPYMTYILAKRLRDA